MIAVVKSTSAFYIGLIAFNCFVSNFCCKYLIDGYSAAIYWRELILLHLFLLWIIDVRLFLLAIISVVAPSAVIVALHAPFDASAAHSTQLSVWLSMFLILLVMRFLHFTRRL